MKKNSRKFYINVECFRKSGVVINHIKCQFGVSEVDILEHRNNSTGNTLQLDKAEAIHNFLPSDTVRSYDNFRNGKFSLKIYTKLHVA